MITDILKQSEKSGHPVVTANSKVIMEQLLGNSVETCFATTTTVTAEKKTSLEKCVHYGVFVKVLPPYNYNNVSERYHSSMMVFGRERVIIILPFHWTVKV